MIERIEFNASEPVKTALSSIGRTEDVRFSPNNRLLAIAGFALNRCLILRVAVGLTPAGPLVTADDFMELTSDSIGAVHGLDFIDDRTLVVANRDGMVSILRLPKGEPAGRRLRIKAVRKLRGGLFLKLHTPGSVAARREPDGRMTLLVCNNYIHQVTRHVLVAPPFYFARRNEVLLKRGLDVPDGVALSHDGQWIAISSHGTRDVKIFSAAAPLDPEAEPAGILRNANYPHGLRFTADDRRILVADAGSPVVLVYEGDGGWGGVREPSRSVAVLDDETFSRGRNNIEEGGPKGLDIDRTNMVVAVTCEEQALAFFSLEAIIAADAAPGG